MQTRQRGRRPGFTLIELLVVISIIAILATLMTVVGYRTIIHAHQHTIAMEVQAFEQALGAYKEKYQDYPPNFYFNVVKAHLKKAFPKHRETDATIANFCNVIQPDEALVFWLGGVPNYSLFDNQEFPLSGPGQPKKFHEFPTARLVDLDGDGYPSFVPAYGASPCPYVYFDSRTYQQAFLDRTATNQGVARPYVNDVGTNQGSGALTFEQPSLFQVISAGLDGHYGDLPPNQAGFPINPPFKQFPSGAYYTRQDRDNVTSFADGALESKLP